MCNPKQRARHADGPRARLRCNPTLRKLQTDASPALRPGLLLLPAVPMSLSSVPGISLPTAHGPPGPGVALLAPFAPIPLRVKPCARAVPQPPPIPLLLLED